MVENSRKLFHKVFKLQLRYDPEISLLGIQQDLNLLHYSITCSTTLQQLCIYGQNLKSTKTSNLYPSIFHEMYRFKKNVLYTYNGIKKWNCSTCIQMVEYGGLPLWNEPVTKTNKTCSPWLGAGNWTNKLSIWIQGVMTRGQRSRGR